jgi:hypothetical protein
MAVKSFLTLSAGVSVKHQQVHQTVSSRRVQKVEQQRSEHHKVEQKIAAANFSDKKSAASILDGDSDRKFSPKNVVHSGSDSGKLDTETFKQKLKEAVDKLSTASRAQCYKTFYGCNLRVFVIS